MRSENSAIAGDVGYTRSRVHRNAVNGAVGQTGTHIVPGTAAVNGSQDSGIFRRQADGRGYRHQRAAGIVAERVATRLDGLNASDGGQRRKNPGIPAIE